MDLQIELEATRVERDAFKRMYANVRDQADRQAERINSLLAALTQTEQQLKSRGQKADAWRKRADSAEDKLKRLSGVAKFPTVDAAINAIHAAEPTTIHELGELFAAAARHLDKFADEFPIADATDRLADFEHELEKLEPSDGKALAQQAREMEHHRKVIDEHCPRGWACVEAGSEA